MQLIKLFSCVGAFCMLAACASTQNQQVASNDGDEMVEITGSHIKRRANDARHVNVTTADPEELRRQAEMPKAGFETLGRNGI
ncbi:hypothetical protein KSF73_02345 [Burkholderiaceae bacterium DAT-1]|nr:hypothetical protein [Burkholderiaceae bacterium DAT-1]